MSCTPKFHAELDARHLTCPLPLLKAKKSLSQINSGEVLRVLTADANSEQDFIAFCKQTGHILESCEKEAGELHIYLRKK